jgi:parallel beta-helix repeat protein
MTKPTIGQTGWGSVLNNHLDILTVVLNVRDYGALGDGTTNDALAVQAAIDAAFTAGGGTVFLPYTATSYAVANVVTLKSGVTLRGDGHVQIKATTALSSVVNVASSDRVTIDGVTLNSNGLITGGILALHGTNTRVVDCKFIDTLAAPYGIDTSTGVTDVLIEGNTFDGCKNPIRLNQGPLRVHIINNRMINWTQRGVYVPSDGTYAVNGLWITGNRISDLSAGGTVRQPIAIAGVIANPNIGVFIEGNHVIGPAAAFTAASNPGTADQISVYGCRGFHVRGNTSTDGGDMGITIVDSEQGEVSGNVCLRNDVAGIDFGDTGSLTARQITVTGNTCMNNGQNRNADRTNAGRAGIRVLNGVDLAFVGNRCGDDQGTKTQQYGISLLNTAGANFSGNRLVGNVIGTIFNDSGNTLIDYGTTLLRVQKASNEVVNNSTTYQDDNELLLALEPGAVYEFEAFIIYDASTVADGKFKFTTPSGATTNWRIDAPNTGAASANAVATATYGVIVAGNGFSVAGVGVGTKVVARTKGNITMSTTAGNVVLQWAQTNLEATDMTVYAGSWLTARRVA